jgi:5'-deoxynucleotidase
MHTSHFLAHINRLRYIKRWSLMRNVSEENVSEHTFHVCLIVHLLCSIGNEIFGKDLPTDKLVTMALFHDATEVFTGDLPTPIKHHNKRFLDEFHKIEQLAAEQLVAMVPDPLKHVYSELITLSPDRELKKWIKAADLLDAYLKCVTELTGGNREFSVAKTQIEASLAKLQMEEVDYFLKHFAPAFDLTIDEIGELHERG